MRRLVVVRPEPGASATAKAAEAMGLETLKMPLFEVEPIDWAAPDAADFDALLLTSANALRHAGTQIERLRPLPAYCVGEATAAAAREAGLHVDSVGTAGVDLLLGQLPSELRLLHLCGEHRRDSVDAAQSIVRLPVYRSRELPPPHDFQAIAGAVVALHSPRAATAVSKIVDDLGIGRERVALAAISEAAAGAAGDRWEALEIADAPTDARLLAIAARLCNNRS